MIELEIINSLRNGTVPQNGLELLATGIDEEIDELSQGLSFAKNNSSSCRFIQGAYGSGKTFLTGRLREIALQDNFAVTQVIINPTLNPGKFRELYCELTRNLRTLKSGKGSGFIEIFDTWCFNQFEHYLKVEGITDRSKVNSTLIQKFKESIIYALYNIQNLNSSFVTAVAAYAVTKLEKNSEKAKLVIDWLRGNDNIKSQVYSNELGLKGKFSDADAYTFLQGLLFLIKDNGFKGTLLIFDEAETIRLLPNKNVRLKSYEIIRGILDDVASGLLKNSMFIFTATPEFFEDRKGIREYAALEERIADPKEVKGRNIRQPIIKLRSLDEDGVQLIGRKILELHGKSYEWNASERISDSQLNQITRYLSEKFGEIKANPRELLKAIIKTLDLLQEDPGKELETILPRLYFANE